MLERPLIHIVHFVHSGSQGAKKPCSTITVHQQKVPSVPRSPSIKNALIDGRSKKGRNLIGVKMAATPNRESKAQIMGLIQCCLDPNQELLFCGLESVLDQ